MSAEMTISFILHTVDVYVIAIARQHFRRRAKCSLDKYTAFRTHSEHMSFGPTSQFLSVLSRQNSRPTPRQ
jgi:hypothetical protein